MKLALKIMMLIGFLIEFTRLVKMLRIGHFWSGNGKLVERTNEPAQFWVGAVLHGFFVCLFLAGALV